MKSIGGDGLTFEDLVNETGYWISFEQVSVPQSEGVNLRFIVNKAKEGWHLRVHPQPDKDVTTYQIDFPYYVTFLVAVDVYTRWNDRETFRGDAFRIYSESPFKEYLEKDFLSPTMTAIDYPGKEPTLYGVACNDHIVYVVSYVDPIVKEINFEDERNVTEMNTTITTKMKINKPASEVFEAIVTPEKMGGYWFSSGTSRVEQGKTITWKYEEYGAEGNIHVLKVEENKEIVFSWGETTVTMAFLETDEGTLIEVSEAGLKADDPEIVNKMLGQKEGWVYMLTCLKGYVENDITTLRASLVH